MKQKLVEKKKKKYVRSIYGGRNVEFDKRTHVEMVTRRNLKMYFTKAIYSDEFQVQNATSNFPRVRETIQSKLTQLCCYFWLKTTDK